jgi:DNA adenine methylase
MAVAASPLRYPGGKACLYDLMSLILRQNKMSRLDYAEPYAGGCGLALSLLFAGDVADIHINDIDASIWAFWHSVLERTEELVAKIKETPVTIAEWHVQRQIHRDQNSDDFLTLGFSTFFLNRTNRSGIITGASAIGGLSQTGNYLINCRYNVDDLVNRIRRIKKYKDRIHLTNLDALEFLKRAPADLPATTFFCIDPPYFNKGSSLYTSFYVKEDHEALADEVLKMNFPWVVTYDQTDEIQSLYKSRRQFCFDINYSVQTKQVGTELLIASKGLRLPDEIRERQVSRPQYRAA